MDAVGLVARGRVGARVARVDPVHIARAGPDPGDMAGEVAACLRREREHASLALSVVQHDLDVSGIRRPDTEAHAAGVGLRADWKSPLCIFHVVHCQELRAGGVWGGRVPTPRGYPAPPRDLLFFSSLRRLGRRSELKSFLEGCKLSKPPRI